MTEFGNAKIVYHDECKCYTLDDAESEARVRVTDLRKRGYTEIVIEIKPSDDAVGTSYLVAANALQEVDDD